MLGWDISDIIHMNMRRRDYPDRLPTPEQFRIHKELSSADYLVYEHFTAKLLNMLQKQPPDFWDELYQYKTLTGTISQFCQPTIDTLMKDTKNIFKIMKEDKNTEFDILGEKLTIHSFDCAFMKLDTQVRRNLLKMKQYPQICGYSARIHTSDIRRPIRWEKDKLVVHNAGHKMGEISN